MTARTTRLGLRVTDEERKTIAARAEECGLTVSAYLRRSALGATPRERTRGVERDALYLLTRAIATLEETASTPDALLAAERTDTLDQLRAVAGQLADRLATEHY